MNLLCVGDVVGQPGLTCLLELLPGLKQELQVDFVVVNGENADKSGTGLSQNTADEILRVADVVTTGNHCYRRAGEELYAENERLLHPANFPFTEDQAGCCLVDMGRLGVVRVINLMGTAWMEPIDNPFIRADDLLAKGQAKYTVVDFHAESTAEKKALAFHLDGRVSALFGTHTHVQTADEQVLPGGTGYITDAGMTGPIVSVLGTQPEYAVKKQRTHGMVRFAVAEGPSMLNGVLFRLDDATGLCNGVQRVWRKGFS
jgi:metallophosphoesterase (TIGR00282 family)